MPNWCMNRAYISHADPSVLQKAYEAMVEEKFLEGFLPVPADLHIVAGSVSDPLEQSALEAAERRNMELYGFKNWYDWCVSNWGTKWDFGDKNAFLNGNRDSLSATFDTAWAPPLEAYEKLEGLGFRIKAYYFEPGMSFCGIWNKGYDEAYNSGDEIPADLDREMGITESMADDLEEE